MAGFVLMDLAPEILRGAIEPSPIPVRTLEALHLATVEFMRTLGQPLEIASYDERMRAGARGLGIPTRSA